MMGFRPPPNYLGDPLYLRTLLVGSAGVGKTASILETAKYLQDAEESATFWICDTDNKIAHALSSERYKGLQNVRPVSCPTWPPGVADKWEKVEEFADLVRSNLKAGDFIGIDRASRIKNFARDYYVWKKHGMSYRDFIRSDRAKRAKEGKKKGDLIYGGLEGATDWSHIGILYDSFLQDIVISPPAHVFLTADVTTPHWESESDHPDRVLLSIFEEFEVIPGGDSSLIHWVTDCVMFTVLPSGDGQRDYRMASARWDNKPRIPKWTRVTNFPHQFLVEHSGWRYVAPES